MSYLEQSTRYVPYTDRRTIAGAITCRRRSAAARFTIATCGRWTRRSRCYAEWIPRMQAYFEARHPRGPADSEAVHRAAIRAKALDTLRGLLPAATQSNVGPLRQRAGVRVAAAADARPSAARGPRVRRRHAPRAAEGDSGVPDPGRSARPWRPLVRVPGVHARRGRRGRPRSCWPASPARRETRSRLCDFDPDGEIKVVAAALYAASALPDDQLLAIARRMTADERARVLRAYVGERGEPPPSARPRVRADLVSIRRPHRLRRIPRSAAAPPADPRMAAADHPARLQRAGRDRRGRRA